MIKNVQTGNFFFGLAGAFLAAVAGAAGWAWLRYKTEMDGDWMILVTGLLVGVAVRYMGGGFSRAYSMLGALFALLGAALGKLLSIISARAREDDADLVAAIDKFDYLTALEVVKPALTPMDGVFLAIALFAAYKIADKEESVWSEV
jgi:hypothetical protein